MRRAIGLFELLDKYDTEKKRRRLLEQLTLTRCSTRS